MKTLLLQIEEHLEELRDAWERGIIRECDGHGGVRSNRNNDLLLAIRAEREKEGAAK